MLPTAYRITRVQKTLRRFEADVPLLNMRVKDLSAERQKAARQFAASLIKQTRAELHRLLEEQKAPALETSSSEPANSEPANFEPANFETANFETEVPCEPAD